MLADMTCCEKMRIIQILPSKDVCKSRVSCASHAANRQQHNKGCVAQYHDFGI